MSWHIPASNSPVAGFLSVSNARARKPCRLQGRSSPGELMRRFPSGLFSSSGGLSWKSLSRCPAAGLQTHSWRPRPSALSPARPVSSGSFRSRRPEPRSPIGPGPSRRPGSGSRAKQPSSAAGLDPAYLMGAALHQAIAGPLVPEGLTNREKFSRLLRGRMGLPARLSAAVKAALPRTLLDDATELERLIARLPGVESKLAAHSRFGPCAAWSDRGKAGDRAIDPLLGI